MCHRVQIRERPKMFTRPSCNNVASLNQQQFIPSVGLVAYLIADKGRAGILFKKKKKNTLHHPLFIIFMLFDMNMGI